MTWEATVCGSVNATVSMRTDFLAGDIQTESAEPILQGNSANRHHQLLTVLIAQKSDTRVDSVTYSYGM
jgi:hypothetical protein